MPRDLQVPMRTRPRLSIFDRPAVISYAMDRDIPRGVLFKQRRNKQTRIPAGKPKVRGSYWLFSFFSFLLCDPSYIACNLGLDTLQESTKRPGKNMTFFNLARLGGYVAVKCYACTGKRGIPRQNRARQSKDRKAVHRRFEVARCLGPPQLRGLG